MAAPLALYRSGLFRFVYKVVFIFWIAPLLAWPQAIWRSLWTVITERRHRQIALVLPWVGLLTYHLLNWVFDDALQHALDAFILNTVPAMVLLVGFHYTLVFLASTLFLGPIHVLKFWPKDWLAPIKPPENPTDTHGSAYWGTLAEAARSGLVEKEGSGMGSMLGRVDDANKRLDPRYRVPGHVLTCAPTGMGKGTGCVIPALLDYHFSIFCLDIKGENYAVTARRRRELGQRVDVIDPFHVTGAKSAGFNPIAILDATSPEVVSDANMLADMLVLRTSGHVDPHWDESAMSLLAGLLVYVATLPDVTERHLGTVRRLITQPEAKLLALLETLSQDESVAFGLLARAANTFLGKADRERSGVLSTAQRHTAFLDDPRIVEALQGELDFAALKRTCSATVYLVIPPDKLSAYNRFARLAIGLALKAMIRTPVPKINDGKRHPPVLFLLDEFAQLGHFAPVEEAISLLRGYGVTLWILVQDLSQLEAVYARWRTFLANSTLQAFGTQDQMTARYLSEALGQGTIRYLTASESRSSSSSSTTSSESVSTHLQGRSLMTPDEIRRLGPHAVIILQQGQPPFILRRLNYLTDPECAGMFDPNPMHAGR